MERDGGEKHRLEDEHHKGNNTTAAKPKGQKPEIGFYDKTNVKHVEFMALYKMDRVSMTRRGSKTKCTEEAGF